MGGSITPSMILLLLTPMFQSVNVTFLDIFTTFDKNGDGFASKSEIGDAKWKVIFLYDLNSKYAREQGS